MPYCHVISRATVNLYPQLMNIKVSQEYKIEKNAFG
jgi:hypothetical protein